MSKAREIADTRLAKGEITVEEHREMIDRLSARADNNTRSPITSQALPETSQVVDHGAKTSKRSGDGKGSPIAYIVGGLIGLVVIAMLYAIGDSGQGLSVGQLDYESGVVSFLVANESDRSGDVVMHVEQGDINSCHHITGIQPRTRHRIRFNCSVNSGTYQVRVIWSDYSDYKNVAIRID